jgi:predicted site-specific integrase-resolvase
MKTHYTIADVAEIYKVSVVTVRRWINRGVLKNTFQPGRSHVIPAESLIGFEVPVNPNGLGRPYASRDRVPRKKNKKPLKAT